MSKMVLMVDSDLAWQKVCKIKLREAGGIDLVCSSDAETARQMINVYHPAAIILDMILPNEDGFAFLQEMKSRIWLADVPVIVWSRMSHPADVHHCVMLGATAYLNKKKVTTTEELISVVRKYI